MIADTVRSHKVSNRNMPTFEKLAPLAVTTGDPLGIGPEIIAKSWHARKREQLHPFFVIASSGIFEHFADLPTKTITSPDETHTVFDHALPILPIDAAESDAHECAQATIASIDMAIRFAQQKTASAIVTAPITKSDLYDIGFKQPGHTEYLAANLGISSDATVMMLACPSLRVVPLTIHIPLKDVPPALTQDMLIKRITVTHAALKQEFNIQSPQMAICGLNPHAGESGSLGREEVDILKPAIQKLQDCGMNIAGPLAADSLFHDEARKRYDCIFATYHDQALIPFKTIAFHDGVNITLGLPIIRTSPDHGSARDIAGQDKASPDSMIAAIKMAAELAMNRNVSRA